MENPNKLENQSKGSQASHGNRKMANHEVNVETARLLIIFPKEIWVLIFENIFHPEDLLHLTKSSRFFDMLLRNQRTKTSFPEVIKILAAYLAKPPTYKCVAHRRIISKHLLNCRLVCRTWQIGVDTALQSSNMFNKLLDLACHPNSSYENDSHFWSSEQAGKFLKQFDGEYATKYRNTFIDRSLYICFPSRRQATLADLESFTQQLMQIPTIYGHKIWNFGLVIAFHVQPIDPSNIWFYQQLRDFLQLMPNLEGFTFTCTEAHSDDEWKALELSLKSCTFPNLKDLTYLQLDNLPTPVFDALLRRYSHVKMLSSFTMRMGKSDMLMYTHNLPNLTQIALFLKDINDLIQWDSTVALWPLKTLIIRLRASELQLDCQSLFQVLENRWSATLTELKIELFCHYNSQNDHPTSVLPSLKLPNLKVFAFGSTILVPLDFILPMRNSLDRLVVRYVRRNLAVEQSELDVENGMEVQFFRFRSNLKRSNIWSSFPNLNTAEYHDSVIGQQISRRPLSIV